MCTQNYQAYLISKLRSFSPFFKNISIIQKHFTWIGNVNPHWLRISFKLFRQANIKSKQAISEGNQRKNSEARVHSNDWKDYVLLSAKQTYLGIFKPTIPATTGPE